MCAAKLMRDVRYFMKEEHETDAILLATKLAAVGYSVNVRTALGGGTACFRNLRHEFLTVRVHGDQEGLELIVEPRFREHFLIPHPTDEYTELLGHAPDVFIGTGPRLVPIVQILCTHMAASFAQRALALPPWRRTQSMLSKWLPNRARDSGFSRSSAPPGRLEAPHSSLFPFSVSGSRIPAAAGDGGGGRGDASYQGQRHGGSGGSMGGGLGFGGVHPDGFGDGKDGTPALSRISDPLGLPHSRAAPQQEQPQQQQQQHASPESQHQQQQPQVCGPAVFTAALGSSGNSTDSKSGSSSNGRAAVPAQASARQPHLQPQRQPLHSVDPNGGYGIMGFIPFGGAGGWSSDTEGPSPPAPGALVMDPRVAPPVRPPPPPSSQKQIRQQLPPQAANAASPTAEAARRQHHGAADAAACVSYRRRQSSLLAAHLAAPAGAPYGTAGAGAQGQVHGAAAGGERRVQTRPPSHLGEAPIHTVRLGFQVASSGAPGSGGSGDGVVLVGGSGSGGKQVEASVVAEAALGGPDGVAGVGW